MADCVLKIPVNHFRGRSDHGLDEKGRLNIPTRFREVLRRLNDDRLIVSPQNYCLKIYPVAEWEKLELALRTQGAKTPGMINMVRHLVGGADECALDRQGRILLPPKSREECGITKDVVVSGMIGYFEVWNKETWERQYKPSTEDVQSFEQTLLELGLL